MACEAQVSVSSVPPEYELRMTRVFSPIQPGR